MNGLTSLPLINKVEFGYSFSGQMTPDQLNNKYFAKCISCIEHLVTSCTYDGQVVKNHSLKRKLQIKLMTQIIRNLLRLFSLCLCVLFTRVACSCSITPQNLFASWPRLPFHVQTRSFINVFKVSAQI